MTHEFECPNCRHEYVPEHRRTIIVVYNQPTYNHLLTVCPECGHKLMLFFSNPVMLTLGYDLQHNFYPPERVKEAYHRMGRPEPQGEEPDQEEISPYQELTPRQEALIAQLGKALTDAPDADLQELFSHPPPKTTLPREW